MLGLAPAEGGEDADSGDGDAPKSIADLRLQIADCRFGRDNAPTPIRVMRVPRPDPSLRSG